MGRGTYLNVAEHHLCVERGHIVLEQCERPVRGFVELDDPATQIDRAQSIALAAADAGAARILLHGQGATALKRLTELGDDLNAGVALALLGDLGRARFRLRGSVHPADAPVAQRYLDAIDTGEVRDCAHAMIAATRQRLRLPERDDALPG